MILKKLELGAYAANCYIVGDEDTKEGMIIDPGAEGSLILKNVKTMALDIKKIVLTHSHIDHIGALSELKSELRIPVAFHKLDASNMPCPPDISLKDGDTIDAGSLKLKTLHTPGHTPTSRRCCSMG